MKKLMKKVLLSNDTVEAFALRLRCSCDCYCSKLSSSDVNSNNQFYNQVNET